MCFSMTFLESHATAHEELVAVIEQSLGRSWEPLHYGSMAVDLLAREKAPPLRLIPNKERAHTYYSRARRFVGIEVKPKLTSQKGYEALGQCLAFLVEARRFYKATHPEYRFEAAIVYKQSDGSHEFLLEIVKELGLPIKVFSVEQFHLEETQLA